MSWIAIVTMVFLPATFVAVSCTIMKSLARPSLLLIDFVFYDILQLECEFRRTDAISVYLDICSNCTGSHISCTRRLVRSKQTQQC